MDLINLLNNDKSFIIYYIMSISILYVMNTPQNILYVIDYINFIKLINYYVHYMKLYYYIIFIITYNMLVLIYCIIIINEY